MKIIAEAISFMAGQLLWWSLSLLFSALAMRWTGGWVQAFVDRRTADDPLDIILTFYAVVGCFVGATYCAKRAIAKF